MADVAPIKVRTSPWQLGHRPTCYEEMPDRPEKPRQGPRVSASAGPSTEEETFFLCTERTPNSDRMPSRPRTARGTGPSTRRTRRAARARHSILVLQCLNHCCGVEIAHEAQSERAARSAASSLGSECPGRSGAGRRQRIGYWRVIYGRGKPDKLTQRGWKETGKSDRVVRNFCVGRIP